MPLGLASTEGLGRTSVRSTGDLHSASQRGTKPSRPCSSKRRRLVVADIGMVCTKLDDELILSASDLGTVCILGVPEDVSGNGEALALLMREVAGNQLVRGATEVVDAVGPVLADVDLAVRICDAVDNAGHGKGDRGG